MEHPRVVFSLPHLEFSHPRLQFSRPILEFDQICAYLTRKCSQPKQHTCQSPHNPARKTKALPRVPHPRTNTGQISKSKLKDSPRLPPALVQFHNQVSGTKNKCITNGQPCTVTINSIARHLDDTLTTDLKAERRRAHVANKMFAQWCVDVQPKVYIFVPRLVSGPGRGFETAPLRKHKRCASAFRS
jgi:hypothetical protein